jgi:hypothetical protein
MSLFVFSELGLVWFQAGLSLPASNEFGTVQIKQFPSLTST